MKKIELTLAFLLLAPLLALAQAYPSKPVRMVVPYSDASGFEVGGSTPRQLADVIMDSYTTYQKIVIKAGIKPE